MLRPCFQVFQRINEYLALCENGVCAGGMASSTQRVASVCSTIRRKRDVSLCGATIRIFTLAYCLPMLDKLRSIVINLSIYD
jgi:hypothetical protein